MDRNIRSVDLIERASIVVGLQCSGALEVDYADLRVHLQKLWNHIRENHEPARAAEATVAAMPEVQIEKG